MAGVRPATLDVAAITTDGGPGHTLPLADAPTSREALREGLRRAIELGVLPAGVRLRRGNDIAREIGLSRSTVSAAVFDLVQDGLIDRCVGGGAVVRERHAALEIRVVPLDKELDVPLVEEVPFLTFPGDDRSSRRFTQSVWGRQVAAVRIECDPKWWSPRSTPRWSDVLGPHTGNPSTSVTVTDLSAHDERRVVVRIDHGKRDDACIVELHLAKGLYRVELG